MTEIRQDNLNLLKTALNWFEEGRKVALATVIQTWGSAPRPAGSHLIIDEEGSFLGSVSAGCVEGAVILEAIELLKNGQSKILKFGVGAETAWAVGLSCGGRIEIYIEPITDENKEVLTDTINVIEKANHSQEVAIVVTNLITGAKRHLTQKDVKNDFLEDEINKRLLSGNSGIEEFQNESQFVQIFNPLKRLVVIGAVHITQALAPMAQACGFDLNIIDPRSAFASPERFEGYKLEAQWPLDIFNEGYLDRFTALVALTHDPKIDDHALKAALDAGCFYVGALGSKKTHAKRVDRLLQMGVLQQEVNRIHAPIGLDIGAATPAEIALAIMAQIVAIERKKLKLMQTDRV